MPVLNRLAAATLLAAPMLILDEPAQAFTARQASLQGYGIYTTSKGIPEGYRGGYYLPSPPPPPGLFGGFGYGYGYPGVFRRRPYFYGY